MNKPSYNGVDQLVGTLSAHGSKMKKPWPWTLSTRHKIAHQPTACLSSPPPGQVFQVYGTLPARRVGDLKRGGAGDADRGQVVMVAVRP